MKNHEDRIQVTVFVEDAWPHDALAYFWQQIREDKPSQLFWRNGNPMELNDFIRAFGKGQAERLLLPIFYVPEGESALLNHLMGMGWIDEIEGHRCAAHYWFNKKYWGEGRPLTAIRKGLALLLQPPFNFELFFCRGNAENFKSMRFVWEKLGVHLIGTIPDWYRHGDKSYAATMGYLTKADILAHEKQPGPDMPTEQVFSDQSRLPAQDLDVPAKQIFPEPPAPGRTFVLPPLAARPTQ